MSTSNDVASSIAPPAATTVPKKLNAVSESLDETQIALSQSLNHAPKDCEEYQKMISGMLYKAFVPTLAEARRHAHAAQHKYNNLFPENCTAESLIQDRAKFLKENLIGYYGKDAYIEAPLYVDYGCNIRIGDGVYMNYNCVILDCTLVTIGARTMFGPGVNVLTATHETGVSSRNALPFEQFAKPIVIGEDCWIGAGAIILPGVTIGDGCTIGAGERCG
ncbi:trimeric LpxA-like protein [Coprinopsis sp. MPI-PUGE-AT-0042]|nr:trimeric LpxA-like protein [Coprinopsis sp. MPI-PUGE-AT-0042]